MLNWNFFFLGFVVLFVSSCGFKPIYKADNSNYHQLQNIEIESINSIEGAEFYNQLKNILPHQHDAQYQLVTTLSFSENYNIIQNKADVFSEIVTVYVNFKLLDKTTDQVLLNSSFSKPSSYNTTFSPYSNLIQKHDILKNLSIMVAEEIRNRIIIYFSNN
ncbi:MAG: hypothetical protein EKK61_00855 [Rickettsiales bacterium]|nr:MAG: hypothetical protein EKK61_00855 [Rickettsiales bacterium]